MSANSASRPLILVTGASGYIGGRLVSALRDRGERLRCMARRPDELRARLDSAVEVVPGDVLDPASLTNALAGGCRLLSRSRHGVAQWIRGAGA